MNKKIFILDKETVGAFAGLYCGDVIEKYNGGTLAIGYVDEGQPVGLMLGQLISDDEIVIDWLYVDENKRHQGIGRALYNEYISMMMDIPTVMTVSIICKGESIKKSLEEDGFIFDPDEVYQDYETTLESMIDLPTKDVASIKSIADLSEVELRNLNQIFYTGEVPAAIILPVTKEAYIAESLVNVSDHKVTDMLLLKQLGDTIDISYAYSSTPQGFGLLIGKCKQLLETKYGKDQKLHICALDKNSRALAEKLFKNVYKDNIYRGCMVL